MSFLPLSDSCPGLGLFRAVLGIALFAATVAHAQTPGGGASGQQQPASQTEKQAGREDPSREDPGYVMKVNVHLVNVFTNVTDASGAIVGGLTKDDFAVTEDGRPQTISVFERQSELPLSLALAIDTSGSVRKDLPLEQEAAKKFVHALLRGQDQMSLMEFSTDVRQVVPFTNQASKIDRGLGSLRVGPATALYDAIFLASESLARQGQPGKPNRKVLVLVTDGGDTANTVTYADALEKALRGEVMVYSIIDVPIAASAGRDTGGEHALITLAEQTGGKYFYASAGGLDKAFDQVSEDLRTQYLIGYYPAKQMPGQSFHRIHVGVPRAAAEAFEIRYRTGYYADGPGEN
jgi:Ca-activated chloride channel family protein